MRRPRLFIGPQGMGGMVGLWGASSLIKSIQRGTISIASGATSNTATISAVSLPDTRICMLGINAGSDANLDSIVCRVALTDATTVTATVNSTSASVARVVGYEVIEYLPGVIKSVQRGTITTVEVTSGTDTIIAVNTGKAQLDSLGFTTTSTTTAAAAGHFRLSLTDSTTVSGVGLGAITRTAGYQVLEWF